MTDLEMKAILEELATVQSYLVAAQGILDSGYMPDITPLESRVADLCQRVQQAPKEIHDQCLAQLVSLLEQLNLCEKKMRTFHEMRHPGDKI